MGAVVVRRSDSPWSLADHPSASGIRVRQLVGGHMPSIHMAVAEVEVPAAGEVGAHIHAFEESFYVLDGSAIVTIGASSYEVSAGDFGFAGIGIPHAWRVGDQPLRILRVTAPQPRELGPSNGTFPAKAPVGFGNPQEPQEVGAPFRPVGRFDEAHLPAPGPLAMRGFRGPNMTNASQWTLVDELIGAVHHTMFVIEFAPKPAAPSAPTHYHPFEEAFYFVRGRAVAHLDGEDVTVGAGDVVWSGVNSLHGFTNAGEEPVRWIEIQAPAPPASGAFFFPAQWAASE